MTEETKRFLAQATTIIDQHGRQITVLEKLDSYSEEDRPEYLPKFRGQTHVQVRMGNRAGLQPIEFPIQAESLEEAFDKFQDSVEAFIEKKQKEASSIALPTFGETSQILKP